MLLVSHVQQAMDATMVPIAGQDYGVFQEHVERITGARTVVLRPLLDQVEDVCQVEVDGQQIFFVETVDHQVLRVLVEDVCQEEARNERIFFASTVDHQALRVLVEGVCRVVDVSNNLLTKVHVRPVSVKIHLRVGKMQNSLVRQEHNVSVRVCYVTIIVHQDINTTMLFHPLHVFLKTHRKDRYILHLGKIQRVPLEQNIKLSLIHI